MKTSKEAEYGMVLKGAAYLNNLQDFIANILKIVFNSGFCAFSLYTFRLSMKRKPFKLSVCWSEQFEF